MGDRLYRADRVHGLDRPKSLTRTALTGGLGKPGRTIADYSSRGEGALPRILELDGLRGIACLTIVAYHLRPVMVPYGWTSVDLFFVLSGYLITAILIRHEGSPRLLRNFYVRRALRIWPIYYLTILVIAIAGPLLPRPTSWAGLGNRAFAVVTLIAFVTVVFAMARGVLPTFGRPPVGAAFSVLAINLLFAGFVGLVVTTARTPVVAWLRRPRLVHLGKISYGLYVYHFIVFLTLRIHGHPFLRVR